MEQEIIDWISQVPQKNIDWEINPDSKLVVLKKPKFQNAILKKYFLSSMKNPNFSVKLDKIGSFVWNIIDGKNTIGDIGKKMKIEFGESIEPVHDRLGQFIQSLKKHHFIQL